MKALKITFVLVSVFLTLPIAFYLQYKVFVIIGASELMWFLFWINVPLGILLTIVGRLLGDDK